MAINFPDSPVNGDTHVVGNVTYVYNNAKNKWVGAGQTPNDRLTEGSNSLEITAGNDLVWTGNRVGFGTTGTPGAPLHITSADDIVLRLESTDRFSHIDLVDNTTTTRITTDGDTGTLRLRADKDGAASGTAITFEVDGAEKARFNSSGVLDINKASAPGLVVGGDGGSGPYHLEIGQIGANGSGGINSTGASAALKFQLNGSDVGRFDLAGRLLIGNSTATITEAKIEAYADNAGNNDVLCLYNKDIATGNTANILFAPSNSVAGARIICEAMEDFSTSANRTADLSFVTRQDGTLAEAARMTSAGYFTVPRQPSFRAGRSTNYTPGALTDIVFNVTNGSYHHNNGGHYNTSNGRFTAPVAGMYTFSVHVIWQSLTSGQAMDDAFDLRVNDVLAGYSFRRAEFIEGTTGNSNYFTDFGSYDIYLEANEYVTVRNRFAGLTVHGNQYYTTFSGCLIA